MGIVYVVLEACTIVVCLHALYGEKIKLDINTVLYIVLECGLMSAITHFDLNQGWSVIIHLFIALYCLAEFKENIIALIVNMMLLIVVLACLQIVVSVIFSCIAPFNGVSQDVGIIIINCGVFVITLFTYRKIPLKFQNIFRKKKYC
jgi:hypothetical protein